MSSTFLHHKNFQKMVQHFNSSIEPQLPHFDPSQLPENYEIVIIRDANGNIVKIRKQRIFETDFGSFLVKFTIVMGIVMLLFKYFM